MSTRSHQKCPREFTLKKCPLEFAHFEKKCPRDVIVHEMSPSRLIYARKDIFLVAFIMLEFFIVHSIDFTLLNSNRVIYSSVIKTRLKLNLVLDLVARLEIDLKLT